jgi:ribonuclease HIII
MSNCSLWKNIYSLNCKILTKMLKESSKYVAFLKLDHFSHFGYSKEYILELAEPFFNSLTGSFDGSHEKQQLIALWNILARKAYLVIN